MARLVVQGIKNLSSDPGVSKLIPCLNPTYRVTCSANAPAGLVTRSENYPAGLTVTAKAVPSPGCTFIGWSGDISGAEATTTFVMGASPKNLRADFKVRTNSIGAPR
jgi:hypothetical protein